MKHFIVIGSLFFAQLALADCPDLRGVYVKQTKPVEVIRINQRGCEAISISRNGVVFGGEVNGKKRDHIKYQWSDMGLVETDYYDFGNVADTQKFALTVDGDLRITARMGKHRSGEMVLKRINP